MSGYAERLRHNTHRSDRFGGMRPPTNYVDYYKAVNMTDVAEGRYPCRMVPPSPSKWPVTPVAIVKHRVEVDKGEKPKWKLGSDSFYDGLGLGDPPMIIDRLLLGISELCWVVEEVERNGKLLKIGQYRFPRKLRERPDFESFVNAIALLSPMRSYVYLLLVRGVITEMKQTALPEPGKRVWKKYQLTPADPDLPIEEWAPVYLECGSNGFYSDFLDAMDTAEGFSKGRYDVWDRKRGANFVIKRGKAHSYSVIAKANTGQEIPQELWKEMLADKNYPSLKNKLNWMCKEGASTDEGIQTDLMESHWFNKLLKYVPKIAEYLDGEHDEKLEEDEASGDDMLDEDEDDL